MFYKWKKGVQIYAYLLFSDLNEHSSFRFVDHGDDK